MREDITVIHEGQRPKRIRKDTKYRRDFVHQLNSGIRYTQGLSVSELCNRWKISRKTFQDWVDSIPEFAKAYELSKPGYASYWHENFKGILTGEIKGNAGCAIFAMTNIEQINWASKVDVSTTTEQIIGAININILEAPMRALGNDNVVDGEIVECVPDNVVSIHDK